MKNKTFIQFATALIIICATQTAKGLAIPTSKGDTDEYYEALGIANGPKARMGELHMLSLKNAQDIIRQKMAHTYKGVIEDYIRVYGNNRGTDIDTKMERIGKQFINVFLNDTREIGSPEFTEADQDGNVTCYVLARVYKRGLPDKMADYISGSHELEGEIEGKALREIIKQHFENQRVSDVYPFSPRVFIPGMQQLYKGSKTKAALFIAGEAAAIGGIVACENLRASSIAKLNGTHDSSAQRKYLNDADRRQNLRNGFIAGAAIIYLWNIIDGCVAKGEERAWTPKVKIAVAPKTKEQFAGMAMVLNF